MACEVFKIVNNMSPSYISDLVKIKTSVYDFRGERKADVHKINTTRYDLSSSRSEAAMVWNSLPTLKCDWMYPTRNFAGWSGLGTAPDLNVLFVVPKFNPCYVTFTCSC